ncbi:DUF2256 domain-containing protein [Psychrobacter sp.]
MKKSIYRKKPAPFSWRKKWEKDWEQVVYCSERCRRGKGSIATES